MLSLGDSVRLTTMTGYTLFTDVNRQLVSKHVSHVDVAHLQLGPLLERVACRHCR